MILIYITCIYSELMLLHRLAKHPEISSAAQSRLAPANIQVSFIEKNKQTTQQDISFTLRLTFKQLSFQKPNYWDTSKYLYDSLITIMQECFFKY